MAAIGCTAVQEGSVYLASATGNATAYSYSSHNILCHTGRCLLQELQAAVLDARSEAAALCELMEPEEKQALLTALQALPTAQLEAAVAFVAARHPGLQQQQHMAEDGQVRCWEGYRWMQQSCCVVTTSWLGKQGETSSSCIVMHRPCMKGRVLLMQLYLPCLLPCPRLEAQCGASPRYSWCWGTMTPYCSGSCNI